MISGLVTIQVADFTLANLKTVVKNLLQPLNCRHYSSILLLVCLICIYLHENHTYIQHYTEVWD
jgi:hypothetical protein